MTTTYRDHTGDDVEITRANEAQIVENLVLVLAEPHRLLGIISPADYESPFDRPEAVHGSLHELLVGNTRGFVMYQVCVYASQLDFQANKEGTGTVISGNRLVIPFDGLAPLQHLYVRNYTGVVILKDEPEDSLLRRLLVEGYLNYFDPSPLTLPTSEQTRALGQ